MHTRRRFIGSESWPKVEELGPHGSYLFSIRRNRRVVPLLSCARCLVVPEAGGKAHVDARRLLMLAAERMKLAEAATGGPPQVEEVLPEADM